MDDGVASSSSFVWFIILLLLEMLFYSFDSAFQYRKEAEHGDEEKDETGRPDRKQVRLDYLTSHMNQYTSAIQLGIVTVNILFGALYLSVIAIAPIITGNLVGYSSLAIGGTSVIIVVGVALETVKQMEAQMLMRHYKGFLE